MDPPASANFDDMAADVPKFVDLFRKGGKEERTLSSAAS